MRYVSIVKNCFKQQTKSHRPPLQMNLNEKSAEKVYDTVYIENSLIPNNKS